MIYTYITFMEFKGNFAMYIHNSSMKIKQYTNKYIKTNMSFTLGI